MPKIELLKENSAEIIKYAVKDSSIDVQSLIVQYPPGCVVMSKRGEVCVENFAIVTGYDRTGNNLIILNPRIADPSISEDEAHHMLECAILVPVDEITLVGYHANINPDWVSTILGGGKC